MFLEHLLLSVLLVSVSLGSPVPRSSSGKETGQGTFFNTGYGIIHYRVTEIYVASELAEFEIRIQTSSAQLALPFLIRCQMEGIRITAPFVADRLKFLAVVKDFDES